MSNSSIESVIHSGIVPEARNVTVSSVTPDASLCEMFTFGGFLSARRYDKHAILTFAIHENDNLSSELTLDERKS